jgi:hypothetical protein
MNAGYTLHIISTNQKPVNYLMNNYVICKRIRGGYTANHCNDIHAVPIAAAASVATLLGTRLQLVYRVT